MSCRICGTHTVDGQYCMACGQPSDAVAGTPATALATRRRPERSTWLAFQEIRLLACPKCGAPNSAARWLCARCGETMDDQTPDIAALPGARPDDTADEPATVQPESAPWLAVITGVVSVAALAVAVAMLVTRGVGPFGGEEERAALPTFAEVPVEDITASAAGGAAENLTDKDTATAWRVSGDGAGHWVQIELERPVQIDHLLVWNGEVGEAGTNRVKDVMISFPDVGKSYTAEFLADDANFRVDMEDPPVSSRIRIEILSAHGDAGRTGLTDVKALMPAAPPEDG